MLASGAIDTNPSVLHAPARWLARLRREQDGVTLIELLIVIVALVAISSALMDALTNSARVNARDTEWALSLQAGRTGLTRMASEVRQSYSMNAVSPNSIDFNVTEGSTSERVFYECDIAQAGTSYRKCVRLQTTIGGTLPALSTGVTIISNVLNGTNADPVFTYSPDALNPNYVALRIELPSSGNLTASQGLTHKIVFEDGAFLRNQSVN